jgi:hypothetical protein
MSISSLESDFSADQLARLEATLSSLGATRKEGKPPSDPIRLDELRQAVVLIQTSISELQKRIAANERQQEALAVKSRELKTEIQRLTDCIAKEVSHLVSASQSL